MSREREFDSCAILVLSLERDRIYRTLAIDASREYHDSTNGTSIFDTSFRVLLWPRCCISRGNVFGGQQHPISQFHVCEKRLQANFSSKGKSFLSSIIYLAADSAQTVILIVPELKFSTSVEP